jgi:hypothetical protein
MSNTVEALERQLAGQKELIEHQKMVQRLLGNRDFKKLIQDEFCVKECARYAQMSADPQLSASERADALATAQAAGHLRRWLQVKQLMGNTAANSLEAIEAELEQARIEEDQPEAEQE